MNKDVEEFKKIARRRWECLENGDSRTGNTCYEKLNQLTQDLKNKNELEELIVLLEDLDAGVRFEAASKLLFLVQNKAMLVLTDLAKERGILSFTAKQTLKQWEAGSMEK